MENNKNKPTAPETAEALSDDALGEVTGGHEYVNGEEGIGYVEAEDVFVGIALKMGTDDGRFRR